MQTTIGILTTLLLLLFPGCMPNTLEEKEYTLELSHISWGCDCADWAKPADIDKYNDEGNVLAKLSIWVEPDNASLKLPDTLGYNGDHIKFTGHFYSRKGFPEGYRSSEYPDKARVFRYTKYEVVSSNYKYYKADAAE